MIKKIWWILGAFLFFNALSSNAVTPGEVLDKAMMKIQKASGVSGQFRSSGEAMNASGSFRIDGKKFHIESPQNGIIWYDGKEMWTLNPRNREVTLTVPDMEELKEVNPMLYISEATTANNIFFSKTRKETGKYLVVMNPKRPNSQWKAVEVTINAKSYHPERIIVRGADDKVTTLYLSGLNYTNKFINSDFTFPKEKYKGYEIVDLR